MMETLDHYLVKRTKAYAWNFRIVSGQQNAKNLKALKSALRSSKNVQKLTFLYDVGMYDIFSLISLEVHGTSRHFYNLQKKYFDFYNRHAQFLGNAPFHRYQSSRSILKSYSQSIRGQSSLKNITSNIFG